MQNLLAPCGIDCAVCEAYKATQTNDQELFHKLADNYKKRFDKVVSYDQLECDGCPSDGRHIGFCAKCEIRACAFGKGYATCAECADFPCTKGSFIWTENSKSKAALETLKK